MHIIQMTIDPDKATAFVLDTKDPVLSSLALYASGGCGREDVINALVTCQRDDGGWISNHGEEHRAAFTVEALFLFRRIGVY